jgi:phasin
MSTNPQFEVPVDLRDFAQKSVEQARKAFEGFVSVAQKTADAVDSAGANMRANAKSVSSKSLGYAEQNVNAAFDFAHKLVQAKDPQEALALQSEFLKSQLANLQAQAKEIGAIMQSSATPKSE